MIFNWLKTLLFGRKASSISSQSKRSVAKSMQLTKTRSATATTMQESDDLMRPVAISDNPLPLATLKRLAPLREFDDLYLKTMPQKTLQYAAGSVIFKTGQDREQVFYLLRGMLELFPKAKNSYEITEDSTFAQLPIDSGKRFSLTAVAKTDVTLLAVPGNIIQAWGRSGSSQQAFSLKTFTLEVPAQVASSKFCDAFCKECRDGKLRLPSLPNVAMKLRKVIMSDISVKDVVEIVQVDAAVVAKLIQIANSALYAPSTPITNCHNAVTRLGFDATRSLVMGIAAKQMFNCKKPKLMALMQAAWKNSLQVSSLSFVIAEEFSRINPEDALLAGLMCNIGVIPILYFAENFPDVCDDMEALEASIAMLAPLIGPLVLRAQGFSEELANIPQNAENWFYESEGDALDLAEIVILAKLHSFIGTPKAQELPYINSIPAYAKLSNGELTPDFSLEAMRKAQDRLNTVRDLFG